MKKNYYIIAISIIILLTLIGTFLYTTKQNKTVSNSSHLNHSNIITTQTDNTPPTYQSLNNFANQINAKLPIKIDDYTVMQHVEIPNATTINYQYMLTEKFFKESSLHEFNTVFIPKLKNQLCQAPELQNLIKNNIDLNYIYYENPTQVFAQFTVNQKNCLTH